MSNITNQKDWNHIAQVLSKDKYLSRLIEKHGPMVLSPVNSNVYFERLVRSICGQQLSTKAADVIYKRFKKTLNDIVSPDTVLKCDESLLRSCGLSFRKISYLVDLSHKVKDNQIPLVHFSKASDEEIMESLLEVKGIGVWTVKMFLMFSLGRPDIFPIEDLGIRNGMQKVYQKNLTQEEMISISNKWKPFRTYASMYIWRNLDN